MNLKKEGNGKDLTDGLPESCTFYEKSIVNLLSLRQSVAKECILNTEFLLISKCIQVKVVTVNICSANSLHNNETGFFSNWIV